MVCIALHYEHDRDMKPNQSEHASIVMILRCHFSVSSRENRGRNKLRIRLEHAIALVNSPTYRKMQSHYSNEYKIDIDEDIKALDGPSSWTLI